MILARAENVRMEVRFDTQNRERKSYIPIEIF